MSVDLANLTFDEERVRQFANDGGDAESSKAAQNVLDALNFYRCLAMHREQELARAQASALEAWAGIHVRDAGINVTVKKLREELIRSEARVAALRDIGR